MNTQTEPPRNRLAALLDHHAEHGNAMRADEVQAFVAAWVSGPDDYAAAQWLPEIIGDAALSDAERAELQTLLEQLAQALTEQIGGNTFALWLYPDENGDPDYYTWCNAYLYALDTTPSDWFERAGSEDFEDLFFPLMVLAGVYDNKENNVGMQISDSEYRQLCETLPETVGDIAAFWRVIRNKPQTVKRDGAKIGRNAPCPCGSGKKFKACCAR